MKQAVEVHFENFVLSQLNAERDALSQSRTRKSRDGLRAEDQSEFSKFALVICTVVWGTLSLKTLLLFCFKMSAKLFFQFELINWDFSLQGRGLNEENRSLSGCYTPEKSSYEKRAARKRKAVSEPLPTKRMRTENRVRKTKLSLLHSKRTIKLNVLADEEMSCSINFLLYFTGCS